MLCNKKKKNVKYCEIIQLKTSDYIRLQFYEVNLWVFAIAYHRLNIQLRGSVCMGSMGSMEPINLQGRVLEPINIFENLIERRNLDNEMRYFQQIKMVGTHQC